MGKGKREIKECIGKIKIEKKGKKSSVF